MSFIYIISLNLKTFLQDKYNPILLMRTQDKEKLTLAQSHTTVLSGIHGPHSIKQILNIRSKLQKFFYMTNVLIDK